MFALYQTRSIAALVYENLLQCKLQRYEMLDAFALCGYVMALAHSRAVLAPVCRESVLVVRGNNAQQPQAWYNTLFHCRGGPGHLIVRVQALKRFAAVGLEAQAALLQGASYSEIALRVIEACSQGQLMRAEPTRVGLSGVGACCANRHDLTTCELQQALPMIIERLVSPAAADKVRDAIGASALGKKVYVRTTTRGHPCFTYPLLTSGDRYGDVLIVFDRHPEVQRCVRAGRGYVNVLMRKQSVHVRGYDSVDWPFECQIMLRVAYTAGLAAAGCVKCAMIARVSMPIGKVHLELTGAPAHYWLQLKW